MPSLLHSNMHQQQHTTAACNSNNVRQEQYAATVLYSRVQQQQIMATGCIAIMAKVCSTGTDQVYNAIMAKGGIALLLTHYHHTYGSTAQCFLLCGSCVAVA